MLMHDEVTRLRIENDRLLGLLAASRRRCAEVKRVAVECLDDLAVHIGWTDEPESLELVEQARKDLEIDLDEEDEDDADG